MATIRAIPRSRSASQVVPIYEDPTEEAIPVHDIHLDQDSEPATVHLPQAHDFSEETKVQHAIREFEELASPEHDAALAAEYDDEDQGFVDDLSDHDSDHMYDEDDDEDDIDDEDTEDPFESSELIEDGQQVMHSIEHDTPFRHERFSGRPVPVQRTSNHNYDRSFSTTTAIHLDDHVNPQLSSEDEADPFASSENRNGEKEFGHVKTITLPGSDRQISDTWSTLPEELPAYYKSPLPGRSMLSYHDRSPLSASRSHLATPPSPSPLANRERLLSSPSRTVDNHLSTPTRQSHAASVQRQQYAHDNPQYSSSGRPVFRNPSSVIRMQMSSPPPFSPSSPPRSVRHRREQSEALRGSRHGSPFMTRRQESSVEPPKRHADPNKEYPLVLLHCTLSPLPSTFAFSPAVLEQVLPPAKLRDVALLKERLGAGGTTILERGVLVPHPGDDYELLEERILESLELRRPRVGGCGHFNANADIDSPPSYHSDIQQEGGDAECKCDDCGRHVNHALLSGDHAERRWDVRIYAANGLMRSGAWSAAWREMEKVDVEVGIWLPDHLRQSLERVSKDETEALVSPDGVAGGFQAEHQGAVSMPTAPMSPNGAAFEAYDEQAASAANASSDARSRQRGNIRASTVSFNKSRNKNRHTSAVRLPLQTLLWNYIMRTSYEQRGLLCALGILVIGVFLAFKSGDKAAAQASAAGIESLVSVEASTSIITTTATEIMENTITAEATMMSLEQIETATVTATVTITSTEIQSASPVTAVPAALQACTFAQDDGDEAGMTALPADLARSVLDAVPALATSQAGESAGERSDELNPVDIAEAEARKEEGNQESRQDAVTEPEPIVDA